MSLKRDVWMPPLLRARQVDPFLRALAPHFGLAAASDLRLCFGQNGSLLVLCPVPESGGREKLQEIQGRLAEAFEKAGRSASEFANMPLQIRDISEDPGLLSGVLAHICQLLVPAPEPATDDPLAPRSRRVLLQADPSQQLPGAFAAMVRQSREVSFLVGAGGVTLADLVEDPAHGATLDALRARGLPAGMILLVRDALGAVPVYLPEDKVFPDDQRGYVSGLLNALLAGKLLKPGCALHIFTGPDGESKAILLDPPVTAPETAPAPDASDEAHTGFREAADLATEVPPVDIADELGPALRFSMALHRPDDQAQAALNERLTARTFPLGYRISLAPIPDLSSSEEDIERLRSEIDEREAQIALIQALGRPQLRLLRFTDRQLPALVDGLRKMPRALRQNDGLRYASAHAADRTEPVHFVLYDPETVQFDRVLPEFYWRAVTEDQPICYWLDPHAEEARNGAPDQPHIFVPDASRILPYIDSFGSSLSGTLKLVLGNLFADGSAVLNAPGAQPAFVFRELRDGANEIGVELLDLSRFKPLRASLRWINDHMQVSSPRTADPEDLRELAETLYAGQLAQTMRREMRAEVAALRESWAQAQCDLLGCVDELSAAVARNLGPLRSQLETAGQVTLAAKARLAEVNLALKDLGAAVGEVDGALEVMAQDIPAFEPQRLAFLDRYLTEYDSSEKLMLQTRDSLDALTRRIEQMAQELARR